MKAHVLATKIGGILTDNKYDRFVGGKTRGKLDFVALSKISYSNKVFKKREARKNKDYSVIVLADASGSMYGRDKYIYTRESLELLNDALEKTGVKYAIWAFNGEVLNIKDFEEKKKSADIGKLYEKHLNERQIHWCEHCKIIWGDFERYDVPCPECKRDSFEDEEACGFNADGLAIHLAREALREQPGDHILVVLSDGQADAMPYHYEQGYAYMVKGGIRYMDMKVDDVIKKTIKDGVILCSIGINDSSVLKHYPKENTVVVDDSKQVGGALIKLISKHIKRG